MLIMEEVTDAVTASAEYLHWNGDAFNIFSSIEPVAYVAFGGGTDVDEIVSKEISLFNLDSCAVKDDLLALKWHHYQIQCNTF